MDTTLIRKGKLRRDDTYVAYMCVCVCVLM